MNKRFILMLASCIAAQFLYSQNFEGEVVYTITVKSKMSGISDAQIGALIGTRQEFFIRDGNYKSLMKGQAINIQLYDDKTNRLYNKRPQSDTLYWSDGATNYDGVISFEITKHADTVLGNPCDAIIMKTKTGTFTFYYSEKYKVDSKAYTNHQYGNWAFYISKGGQLPLKEIIDNDQFRLEGIATEIKPLKLANDYFSFPATTPVKRGS